MSERSHLSIGEVLSLLREEFPDVTISKIRFLESQGLVDPERTPSGYRKFYDHDVDRLRWILRQQREHFLPLKVIRGRLTDQEEDADDFGADDADAGGEPDERQPGQPASTGGPEQTAAPLAQVADPTTAAPEPIEAARTVSAGTVSAGAVSTGTVSAAAVSAATHASDENRSGTPGPVPPASDQPRPERQPTQVAAGGGPAASKRPAEIRPAKSASAPAPVTPSLFADTRPDPARPTAPAPKPPASPRRGRPAADEAESYSAEELAATAGATAELVTELKQFGLVSAHAVVAGTPYFDDCALAVTRAAAEFARYGVEVRHLRAWRNAADREAGLFEQIVLPLLRQRNPQARQHAAETLTDLARLGGDLRSALLDQAIRDIR